MNRESLLKRILFLIIVIASMHAFALVFYYYWSLWWYDVVLHYLGGIWLSISVLWFVFFSGYINVKKVTPNHILATGLFGVILLGILWEVFEFSLGANYRPEGYLTDTSIDLIMDMTGGVTGYIYFYLAKYEEFLLNR